MRYGQAVLLVVDPLLADGVTDAQDRPAENLAAERARMEHRADVGIGEIIHDMVLAGFDIDFHLGKAGHERKCVAVVRIFILGNRHQSLARRGPWRTPP